MKGGEVMKKGNLDFGLWLREQRLNRALTLEEFASRCDLSYVTISNIELGKVLPGISAIKKIAKMLELEYIDLRALVKKNGGE
jgi:transcriptional regulator with XRE-family HTH domain